MKTTQLVTNGYHTTNARSKRHAPTGASPRPPVLHNANAPPLPAHATPPAPRQPHSRHRARRIIHHAAAHHERSPPRAGQRPSCALPAPRLPTCATATDLCLGYRPAPKATDLRLGLTKEGALGPGGLGGGLGQRARPEGSGGGHSRLTKDGAIGLGGLGGGRPRAHEEGTARGGGRLMITKTAP